MTVARRVGNSIRCGTKRLESAASENGILVSEVVRQAVVGKDFEFADQGEVALKGFDEPVRAWSVEWA